MCEGVLRCCVAGLLLTNSLISPMVSSSRPIREQRALASDNVMPSSSTKRLISLDANLKVRSVTRSMTARNLELNVSSPSSPSLCELPSPLTSTLAPLYSAV